MVCSTLITVLLQAAWRHIYEENNGRHPRYDECAVYGTDGSGSGPAAFPVTIKSKAVHVERKDHNTERDTMDFVTTIVRHPPCVYFSGQPRYDAASYTATEDLALLGQPLRERLRRVIPGPYKGTRFLPCAGNTETFPFSAANVRSSLSSF